MDTLLVLRMLRDMRALKRAAEAAEQEVLELVDHEEFTFSETDFTRATNLCDQIEKLLEVLDA